jgi:hypothetical protein
MSTGTDIARRANSIPPGTIYLSVSDRQGEAFIQPDSLAELFNTSLMTNILFEPGVVMPDIFYFISTGIWTHLQEARRDNKISFMEAAIENGLLFSAFREPAYSTFSDAYEQIRDTGIRGTREDSDCRHVARTLDRAFERGRNAGKTWPCYWPIHSVGAKFEQRIVRFFDPDGDPETDVSPVDNPEVTALWAQTRTWRTGYLNEARAMGESGLRRGDYLAALGRAAGITTPVDDVREIFETIAPESRSAMRTLCFWMNECYQFNQAIEFGAIPNVAHFDPILSPVTVAALSRPGNTDLGPTFHEEEITANIPPPRVLAKLDATKLLAVRQGPAANYYFDALEFWRKAPLDSNLAQQVKDSFQDYAKALRKAAYDQSQYRESLISLKLAKLSTPAQTTLNFAGSAVVGSALNGLLHTSAAFPFLTATTTSYAAYKWFADRPRRVRRAIRARRPEVNLPGVIE